MMLPEFSRTMRIARSFICHVMDQPYSGYDMIIGRDFMTCLSIDVKHSTQEIIWEGNSVPFRPRDMEYDNDPFILKDDTLDSLAGELILDAKYQAVDTDKIARQQTQLTPRKRDDLANLLRKFPRLFDGKLRRYTKKKVHLELIPGARPVHRRPYPVPYNNRQAFKTELDHLENLKVLEKTGASEWAAPTFIIPKKDGRVRWISDFRELNKCIKRKVYPLPRIHDILRRRRGYKFFTKLDISMQYYTFELDDESKDL